MNGSLVSSDPSAWFSYPRFDQVKLKRDKDRHFIDY